MLQSYVFFSVQRKERMIINKKVDTTLVIFTFLLIHAPVICLQELPDIGLLMSDVRALHLSVLLAFHSYDVAFIVVFERHDLQAS